MCGGGYCHRYFKNRRTGPELRAFYHFLLENAHLLRGEEVETR